MKKPFVVRMTVEAIVMAESLADARGYAYYSGLRFAIYA